jgi:murein DD-endopeptidase MepM/ murein hydrolase activator NlpD
VTPRLSVSGPELRPIPRANLRRLPGDGATGPQSGPDRAPAAPRLAGRSAGIPYPMPPEEGDGLPAGAPPPLAPYPPGTVHLSPRLTAIFGGLFGLATVTTVMALLIQGAPPRNDRALVTGTASANASADPEAPPRPEVAPKKRVRVALPGPWRIVELEKEPGVTVERGTMDRKSLFEALGDKGIAKGEVYRILKALDGVRKFDKSRKKDRYAVALAARKVKAFEYEVSPSEIYQAREGEGGLLTGAKLDLKVGEEEYASSFYVGADLAASARAGGFEDGILAALDEALAGHMSTESFEEGGTVRALTVEETALGLFSRYKRVVAMEYRPPDPAGKPVRIYTFNGQEARGYWNDRGRQPSSGGWRMPCPGAPVTSHFNPKRLHPVLHTVMPHTGTDFGAPTGAPIYSAYKGVVSSAGPLGPCGNAVVIDHPGGITTGYCHMSKLGPVKPGEHVGTHQILGYVGQTGRATGPHLHFFAKKNGQFFDALTLHLDGDRPVPPVDRGAFLAAKAELDRRLDALPLPEPPPAPEKPAVVAAGGPGAVGPGAPSASAEPADTPASTRKGDEPRASGPRRGAMQIGSPDTLAAARAEPGIHPSQLVEARGTDDDEDVSPPGPATPPSPAQKGKPKGKPDPAEEEDDEK